MSTTHAHVKRASDYRPDIDGLRAVAVLAVVLFHAFPAIVAGGFIGVDIFFVISGYLITSIILRDIANDTFTIVNFYVRRVIRIFPALFIVLTCSFIFGWFSLFTSELKMLGQHIFGGSFFISNFFFWSEAGYFGTGSFEKPLLHLWSLGIEEQFYIIFPILIFMTFKKKIKPQTVLLCFFALSFIMNIALHREYQTADFYSPITRFWEIIVGSILALTNSYAKNTGHWVAKISHSKWILSVISCVGFALIIVAIATNHSGSRYPGLKGIVPVLGAAFVIFAGENSFFNRNFLSSKVLVFIGLISYPLYLWHWPIISFLHIIYSEVPSPQVILLAVLSSFFLAWLTYRFVEQRIRFKNKNRKTAVILLCLVFSLGLLGGRVSLSDGLPKRSSLSGYTYKDLNDLKPLPVSDDAGYTYTKIPPGKVDHCRLSYIGSPRTVAVIGDSHAWAAFHGIAKKNRELGLNTVLISNNGLPLMIGAARSDYHHTNTQKKYYQDSISYGINVLTKYNDITDVFFIARGPAYLEKAIPFDIYQHALQSTVDILNKHGKRIFLVTDNPEYVLNPKLAIPRPFRNYQRVEAVPKEIEKQRCSEYLRLLNSIRGAIVIDTLDKYCPADNCLTFDNNNQILNYDTDHLSTFGSSFLAEAILAPYLEEIALSLPEHIKNGSMINSD